MVIATRAVQMGEGLPAIEKLQRVLLELNRLRTLVSEPERQLLCDWLEKAIIETELQIEKARDQTVH
jgi:hypothetical protein